MKTFLNQSDYAKFKKADYKILAVVTIMIPLKIETARGSKRHRADMSINILVIDN